MTDSIDQQGMNPHPEETSDVLARMVIEQANRYRFRIEIDAIRNGVEQMAKFAGITASEPEIRSACHKVEVEARRTGRLADATGKLSKYTSPNLFLLSEYGRYVSYVAEGDPMDLDDWIAGSDLPEIVKARELSRGHGPAKAEHHISVTTQELTLIRAAVDNYRDLMRSPTSAERSALGDDWADEEIIGCNSLLEMKLQLPSSQDLEAVQGPQDYTVFFEVSITAESPEEAAGFALDDLRDTSLGIFAADVVDSQGMVREVFIDQSHPRASYPSPGM